MNTSTLSYPNKEIANITNQFNLPFEKSVSNLAKVIKITTNKESFENSVSILKELEKTIELLPIASNPEILPTFLEIQKVVKDSLKEVNRMFEFIQLLFDGEVKVEIDDDYMKKFLENMKNVQKRMLYISDYLNFIVQLKKSKEESTLQLSFSELIETIKHKAA